MGTNTFCLQDANPNKPKVILGNDLPTKRFKEYNLQLIKGGKVNTWVDKNPIANPLNNYKIIRKQFDNRYGKKRPKAFNNKFPTSGGIVKLSNTSTGAILKADGPGQFIPMLKELVGVQSTFKKGKGSFGNTFNITTPFHKWWKKNGNKVTSGGSQLQEKLWASRGAARFITQGKRGRKI